MLFGTLTATGIGVAQCAPGNGGCQAQSCDVQPLPDRAQPRRQLREQSCDQQCVQMPNRAQAQARSQAPSLSDALITQLQGTLADEFLARDVYRAAAERFGMQRFTNHQRAEEHHIAALTAALRDAGVEPVATAGRTIPLPATLALTQQRIAELEADMIRAYAQLLELGKDTALMPMLTNIQAANRRHLESATGGDGGNGRGHGPRGRRQNSGLQRGCGVDSGEQCASTNRSCRR
ncbi:MAG: hypothetical protein R3F29_02500 [Planctomycetota bacterium]